MTDTDPLVRAEQLATKLDAECYWQAGIEAAMRLRDLAQEVRDLRARSGMQMSGPIRQSW